MAIDFPTNPASWPAFPAAGFRTGTSYNLDDSLQFSLYACLDDACTISSRFVETVNMQPNSCTRLLTRDGSAFCVQLLPTATGPPPAAAGATTTTATTLPLVGQILIAILLGALSGGAVLVCQHKRVLCFKNRDPKQLPGSSVNAANVGEGGISANPIAMAVVNYK